MISTIIIGVLVIALVAMYMKIQELSAAKSAELFTKVTNSKLTDELKDAQKTLIDIQDDLGNERDKNRTLLSQKKSSETRLGQITEHIVPFLENCPYDPKSLTFLGNPIDFLCFDFDIGEIVFLEVKSGNSKASKRQKIIKNIIKTGRVRYAEIRVNEKGVKHRVFEND